MSPLISLTYLLCQSETLEELEQTARELGCIEIRRVYSATHLRMPDGTVGSFRWQAGTGFVWTSAMDN